MQSFLSASIFLWSVVFFGLLKNRPVPDTLDWCIRATVLGMIGWAFSLLFSESVSKWAF